MDKFRFEEFGGIVKSYKYNPEQQAYVFYSNRGIEDGTFAAACYNDNSIEELEKSTDIPDFKEMAEWDIDKTEWQWSIAIAKWQKEWDEE